MPRFSRWNRYLSVFLKPRTTANELSLSYQSANLTDAEKWSLYFTLLFFHCSGPNPFQECPILLRDAPSLLIQMMLSWPAALSQREYSMFT